MARKEMFPSLQAKIKLKGSCPRCRGNLILDGYDTKCVQCGHYTRIDVSYLSGGNYDLRGR